MHLIGESGNVTSVAWQVTLCDPIWHVSSRSDEAIAANCYIRLSLPFTNNYRMQLTRNCAKALSEDIAVVITDVDIF